MKQLAALADQAIGHRPQATGLPKDFLSVLDFNPAGLRACLDLASKMKRERTERGVGAPRVSELGGVQGAPQLG